MSLYWSLNALLLFTAISRSASTKAHRWEPSATS